METTAVPEKQLPNQLCKRMVCLYVGYIGTEFSGLQVNRQDGVRTIEEEIEKALYKCGWIAEHNLHKIQKVGWSRASRTDKGVHACGNVIALKALVREDWFQAPTKDKRLEKARTKNNSDQLAFSSLGSLRKEILEELNNNLPDSIRILGVQPTTKHFDARNRCSLRAYEYMIPFSALPGASESVTETVQKLRDILSVFKGTHRFHNFSSGFRASKKKKRQSSENTNLHSNTATGDKSLNLQTDETSDRSFSTETQSGHNGDVEIEEKQNNNDRSEDKEVDDEEEEGQTSNEQDASMYTEYVNQVIRCWPEHTSFRLKRQEYIRSIYVANAEGPVTIQGKEYLLVKFAGQSFILHQIRKMVGAALAVLYGRLNIDAVKAALYGPYQVPIPLAPSEPLMLVLCDFWSLKKEQYELYPTVSTTESLKKCKEEFLYPAVAQLLEQKRPFERFYIESLYDYGGRENLQVLIDKYRQWELQRRQMKEENKHRDQSHLRSKEKEGVSPERPFYSRGMSRAFPPKLFTQLAVELQMLPGPDFCHLRNVLINARRRCDISEDPSVEECINYLKRAHYI
eukprot:jgi/Galph1/4526/GphlegSOOS_G3139.1